MHADIIYALLATYEYETVCFVYALAMVSYFGFLGERHTGSISQVAVDI